MAVNISTHHWKPPTRSRAGSFYQNCSEFLLNNISCVNTTLNSSDNDGFSAPAKVLIGLALSIVIPTAVIGNLLTLRAFIVDKQLRTTHNCYICNLAVTDLLVGLVSVPFYGSYLLKGYKWIFGAFFCKVWLIIDYTVCTCSATTLIMISWDRYLIVTQGAAYNMKQTKTKALQKIAVCWIFSLLLYTPAILLWDVVRGYSINNALECSVQFEDSPVFITTACFIDFAIPLTLVSTFHTLIYLNLRYRTKTWRMAPSSTGSTAPSISYPQSQPHSSSAGGPDVRVEQKKELEKHKKLVFSLCLLTATYFACWMPFTIVSIVLSICESCISEDLFQAVCLLLWLNSSLNPFLYALTNRRFRTSFRRALTCKWNSVAPINEINVN